LFFPELVVKGYEECPLCSPRGKKRKSGKGKGIKFYP
jgi:hypothetical protein